MPLMFVRCSDVRSGIFCLASLIKSNYHTLPPVGSIVPGLSKAFCARLLQLRWDCCPPLVPGGVGGGVPVFTSFPFDFLFAAIQTTML